MRIRRSIALGAVLFVVGAGPSFALVSGGGNRSKDCWLEFAAPNLALNFPPSPKKGRELRCFDGEAGCDLDGAVDGVCTFAIDVCLYNDDPALPSCTPSEVTGAQVRNKKGDPDLASLQASIDALLPAASQACTSGRTLSVPLKLSSRGKEKKAKAKVKIKTQTAAGKTADTLKLACIPREWPSHGYDHRNTRASVKETTLSPSAVDDLQLKWDFPAGGVSGTPTVMGGRVVVTSWNGRVYSLDAKSGKVKWSYDTQSGGQPVPGVKGAAALTADGRVVVGDANTDIHCLDAKTGKLLWKTRVGDPGVDDFWSSPAIANGRVFMGLASHLDTPCTRGQMVAVDLDDGSPLWSTFMVPEKVCDNDTSIECTISADCGTGVCVDARGAGITATAAIDPTGESIYINTVGCYTFPSVGHSDSILKLDAATGAIEWASRLNPPEQFGACSTDPSIDCGDASVCPDGGTCDPKPSYHDFGFLNGPLLVEAPDGLGGTRVLVASGSKDGSLYALDPDTGSLVWQNEVRPAPVTPAFAGFGLFNGAVGFADGRFHATLYQHIPVSNPQPKHLMAFDAVDGSTAWDTEIGASWGSVGLAAGVVWCGTQAGAQLLAHDAATGAPLVTLPMPAFVTAGPSIVDGVLYTGYGLFGAGGVRAYELP